MMKPPLLPVPQLPGLRPLMPTVAVMAAIHRLGFSIAGLGIMLHVGSDVINAVRPQLLASSDALDTYGGQLVHYAMALVDAEARRRAACPTPPATAPTPLPSPTGLAH